MVTKLYVTLIELITQFPCKIPGLVCARITVVSSLRSKKIPYGNPWADAQSLPHSTFPPVSIKKLEANCLTFELQSLHQCAFETELGEMPEVCSGLSLSSYTGMLFGNRFCLKLTCVREK